MKKNKKKEILRYGGLIKDIPKRRCSGWDFWGFIVLAYSWFALLFWWMQIRGVR